VFVVEFVDQLNVFSGISRNATLEIHFVISFGMEVAYLRVLNVVGEVFTFLFSVCSSQLLLTIFKADVCLFQIGIVRPRSRWEWLRAHVDRRKIALHFPWDLQPFFVAIIDDSSALSSEFTTFLFEIFWVDTCIIDLKVMETSTTSKPAKIIAVLIHHVLFFAVDNFNSVMSCLALYLFSREQLFIILF